MLFRSKYRPRPVLLNPVEHVIKGVQRVGSIPAGTDLMIKNHSSLDAVRRGQATRDDIDVLIAALNMTEALALMRIGEDWKVEIRAAQDALFAVGSRGAETGKFILRGPELIALNLGMEIHDAQIDACTVSEMERAIDMVRKTIMSNRARPIIARKERV